MLQCYHPSLKIIFSLRTYSKLIIYLCGKTNSKQIVISMKMKRLRHILPFCILLVCTSVQIGCKGEDEPQNVQSISFSPQTEKVDSRADFIENSSALGHFIVWGNYDGNDVFTAQKVNRVDGYWEYTPLQYWILSADSYDFSAYSPEGAGTPNIVDNQLASVSYDCNEQQIDLMMAYTAVPKEKIGETVLMTFNHALAAVNFSFKLNPSFTYNHTYKVTSVQWGNVYTQGQFALNSNNTITASASDEGAMNAITAFKGTSVNTTSAMECDYQFVIPQNKTNVSLVFNLEINGESKTITKTVPSINWEAGNKYTYTVSLDPFEITVETTPWEVPTIDHIVVQ